MKHFQYFPQIDYSNNRVTNLLVRGRIRQLVLENTVAYYNYVIPDSERVDQISFAYYGSSNFAWAILYANDIFDMVYDWPLSRKDFDSYIVSKYGKLEYTQSLADESYVLTLGTGSGTFTIGQTVFQGNSLVDYVSKGIVTDWNPQSKELRVKDVEGDFHQLSGNVRNSGNTVSYSVIRRRELIKHYELNSGPYKGTVISKEDYQDSNKYPNEEKRIVSIYDYENELNEAKRNIRLIKPERVFQLSSELKTLFR